MLDARASLIAFLNRQEPELVSFLQTLWRNQGLAITYKELREAILNGNITPVWLEQWQQDYAKFVTNHLQPLWLTAMQDAAKRLEAKYPGWRFDAMADGVRSWARRRGADFVTNSTNAQLQGLQAVIHHAADSGMNVDVLARAIRPIVGLTYQQSIANSNYRNTLIQNGMSQKKAAEKAIRYAARQHRYRAQNIARTELAFAYNQGSLEWARQAQEAGYLGKVKKVWRSARDERTCELCARLAGMEIPLEEPFPFPSRLRDPAIHLAPPAHPSCRCAMDIEETEPPSWLNQDGRYDTIEEVNAPEFRQNTALEMAAYLRSDGSFDLERAQSDYAAFLQTVPERNQLYLVQAFEAVTYTQTDAPDVVFAYDGRNDVLLYNPKHPGFAYYNPAVVMTHELAHRIDKYFAHSWENKAFSDAIAQAKLIFDENPWMFVDYCETYDKAGCLSDILSAICGGEYDFMSGHDEIYWLKQGTKEAEIFANLFSIETMRDMDAQKFLGKYFPGLMKIYQEIEF